MVLLDTLKYFSSPPFGYKLVILTEVWTAKQLHKKATPSSKHKQRLNFSTLHKTMKLEPKLTILLIYDVWNISLKSKNF